MNKLLLFTACLLWLASPTIAQSPTPERKLAILADFSDRDQFAVENRLFLALQELENSGRLSGVELDMSPLVINTGQSDGATLLSAWGLTESDLPVLALVTNNQVNSVPGLLWYWQVEDIPAALNALEAELGLPATASLPTIRAADFTPRNGPLMAGNSLRITLQGTPGSSATAKVGGATQTPLFELESGLYRGEYQVKPEDHTDAPVTVTLTSDSGASVSRYLGQIVLQGFRAPELHSIRQISSGEWMVTGTAPPQSLVNVEAVMTQTFIFKFKSVNTFTGRADSSGQFQLKAFIEENVAGSEGTFTATATLGETSETSVKKMVFQGLRNRPGIPPTQDPYITPWSLAGEWYHGNRPTYIRVNGPDSVVIRNEFGQETVLTLTRFNRLESQGFNTLRGRVEGNTIRWNNGTRWERSRFR